MNVGIICEFDPLHRGHAHLLTQARAMGASAVVCAMSGSFTQRGSFAAVSKAARAEMAVRCGADLVLELPVLWAMATAERFAEGGVSLLARTGVVDTLLFGSESGDLAALRAAAEGLDSPAFTRALRDRQEDGVTFAAARQQALGTLAGVDASLLAQPNNILAVEYLRAIARQGNGLNAATIPRIGAGHDGPPEAGTSSASHLRTLLGQGAVGEVCAFMPDDAADILRREVQAGRIADPALCERAILYRLRTMSEADWRPYDQGGEGLYHRLYRAAQEGTSVAEVLAAAKTKRYPMARLRRMVLGAWLGLPEDVPPQMPYVRVLAANETGRALLRQMRRGGVPVLTKPADAAALGGEAASLLTLESRCADLRALACPRLERPGGDMRATPLMV